MKKIAWTIGGSDSGGGAGIQADIKTFNNLGVHGCSAITALTAQNTLQVKDVEAVSPSMLQAQTDVLLADLPPQSIKTGMLYNIENIKQIANLFSRIKAFKLCDPVMVSTSGYSLLADKETRQAFLDLLLPQVDLLTPNIPEAETLLGLKITTPEKHSYSYIKDLAKQLQILGPRAILLKGGHSTGKLASDYFIDANHSFWLSSKRIDTTATHGTGCTLSAAITACIALDYPLPDAIVIAKAYVNQGLRTATKIGSGHNPIDHGYWPENPTDLPALISVDNEYILDKWLDYPSFPDCGETAIGAYPIVNSSDWLKKLLPLGVSTIQLRIKSDNGNTTHLEEEIARSIAIAKEYNCRLFINDHWKLAIKYGAYGVHLGQEDLNTADINALAKSDLRLGISTHSYSELARSIAYKPSYIALGPIYNTTTKAMPWAAQGLKNLKRWQKLIPCQLVAIGGITLEHAPEVFATGTTGIAVIKDICNNQNPIERTKQWLGAASSLVKL